MRILLYSSCFILISFCNAEGSFNDSSKTGFKEVYIIVTGWHTGIVFSQDSISKNLLPKLEDLRDKAHLDFGWGEEQYYRLKGFDVRLGLKALLMPNSSSLKVKGFNMSIQEYYKFSDYSVKLLLNHSSFEKLCRYIDNSFKKHKGKIMLIENRNNIIHFYKAEGRYSILYNCNTWAADALRYAGVNVDASWIISPKHLIEAVRKDGIVLKEQ